MAFIYLFDVLIHLFRILRQAIV